MFPGLKKTVEGKKGSLPMGSKKINCRLERADATNVLLYLWGGRGKSARISVYLQFIPWRNSSLSV